MKIYLTFDYELYLGSTTGSVERCLLQPTELIFQATNKFNIPTIQFVDACYLLKLKSESEKHPDLLQQYQLITQQLRKLVAAGHELQLHIHPHWIDCFYDGERWIMDTSRYRLHLFTEGEIAQIVQDCIAELRALSGIQEITTYRAGGWCIQPFKMLKSALQDANIKIDSSVFPGGHYKSKEYFYDFRESPILSSWQFENDPLVPVMEGSFKEIPITSIRNSPFFYWKLFLLGRLFPERHKPIGDGRPMTAPGQRRKLLTRPTLQTVSLDGYNAALLSKALRQQEKNKAEAMVIIGHPKSLTRYGADALKKFIAENHQKHEFTTFNKSLHS